MTSIFFRWFNHHSVCPLYFPFRQKHPETLFHQYHYSWTILVFWVKMSIKNTLFWLFGCCFPAVVNFHFPIEEMLHILEKGPLADVTTQMMGCSYPTVAKLFGRIMILQPKLWTFLFVTRHIKQGKGLGRLALSQANNHSNICLQFHGFFAAITFETAPNEAWAVASMMPQLG